jgi:hypothetical protein
MIDVPHVSTFLCRFLAAGLEVGFAAMACVQVDGARALATLWPYQSLREEEDQAVEPT